MNIFQDHLTKALNKKACIFLIATFSASAMAATLTIPDSPLPVLNNVQPNIMLMLDSSGSMSNIVPDKPYDSSKTHLAAASCTNVVPVTSTIDLWVTDSSTGGPKIRYGGTSYDYGTGATQRCFNPTATYTRVRLNADGTAVGFLQPTSGYLATAYSGDYLNWYFDPNSISGVVWNKRQSKKPVSTTELALSRIEIARMAAADLVAKMDKRLRVGFSIYNNPGSEIYGGSLLDVVSELGEVGSTKRTDLIKQINAIKANGATPLAETLSDIGHYFALQTGVAITDDAAKLSLYPRTSGNGTGPGPKPATPTLVTVKNTFNSHSFRNVNNLTIVPPITQSCQSSSVVFLTDGRPNNDQSVSSVLADYDGDCKTGSSFTCTGSFDQKNSASGRTYEGSGSDYLDDVALAMNEVDLRPDFAAETDGKQFINNLTTYVVGFADPAVQNDALLKSAAAAGGGGKLLIANDAGSLATTFKNITADIQRKSASGSAVSSNSTRLDAGARVYIAQFNSGDWSGTLSAYKLSTGTAAGSNCPTVKLGGLCPISWEAGSVTPAADKRVIITAQNTLDAAKKVTARTAVAFQWSALNAGQKDLLQIDPTSLVADSNGELRLNWLRGDQTQEQSNDVPQLRSRTTVLGDIVNSDPYFYGPPSFNYGFDGYAKFRSDNAARVGVVYVAANDGMLHGFAAEDGKELLAYVPSPAFGTLLKPKLARLSNQTYDHVFTADGSPTVGDAYFKLPKETKKTWRTVLASGMRSGGQGVFALDVTDPTTFTEANASKTLLWEFTDADDADLGYTFSQPSIVQMHDNEWYVLIGSGYNNGEADGNASSTGTGALFLLKLSGPTGAGPGAEENVKWVEGTDYYKLDLGGGTAAVAATMILPLVPAISNGVATPIAVDVNGDNKVDYIYVGDEEGNLKRIFVKSSTATNWNKTQNISTLFTAVDPKDSTTRQPISARPEVGFNTLTSGNATDLVVYFGTGRYIDKGDAEVKDSSGTHKAKTQSFYAIFDDPKASASDTNLSDAVTKVALTDLQSQRVNSETQPGTAGTACSDNISTSCARTVSSNAVAATKKGWYLNLYNSKSGMVDTTAANSGANLGERAVTPPALRNGRIVFTTLIPSSNPCDTGGNGWLMELDAKTGGATSAPPLDINNDNAINDSDTVKESTTATETTVSNGLRSRVGILPRPTVLLFQDEDGSLKEFKLNSGLGGTQSIAETANDRKGRVSWREVIK